MSVMGEFRRRLNMLLHRGRFQRELDEEMRLHLELRRAQQISSGLAPEAARWKAQQRFGNITRIHSISTTPINIPPAPKISAAPTPANDVLL